MTTTTTSNDASDIHIVRTYDAPVQAVWDAWTDPAQVAQWWGPRGFSITTHGKDLRSGGSWDYTMHGPDGTDYPNTTHYLEVDPLRKLVYDHGAHAGQPPMFRVTVLFSEVEGKTLMDMRMHLPTPEAARQTRAFIRQAGGNATWDRLAEYLARQLRGEERFVINRSFEVPAPVMFDMWTEPAQLARWLAPSGFEMRFIRADIRAGGDSFFCMTAPQVTMYARARYEQVRRPDLLVYTQQFCDEHQQLARHPMAPTWPATMRITVTFNEESAGCTRVTVSCDVTGAATSEEMATFTAGRTGMTSGWTGSFDKLESVLAERETSAV